VIVTRLWARCSTNHGSTSKMFLFSKASKLALGPLASYQGTMGTFPKVTSIATTVLMSRIGGSIPPQPQCLHSIHRDHFNLETQQTIYTCQWSTCNLVHVVLLSVTFLLSLIQIMPEKDMAKFSQGAWPWNSIHTSMNAMHA
jgi:hypothetical protein